MGRSPDEVLDDWLVLAAQGGEVDAFEALARRWHRRLIAHAYRRTAHLEGAAEAAQEAWLAIIRGLPRLNDPSRFPGWAYRIVDHKAVDWLRRRRRQRSLDDRLQAHPEVIDPNPQTRTPEAEEPPDAVDQLRHALNDLPSDQRLLLALSYTDGRSVRDIAELLRIPEGTVKSRLFHARQHLKRLMEQSP
ncbi:RNA polymerase sigma factor [Tautonia rosea]|uniref:RNA polymerase sigma factor n=1 Tax=Tautonia rosea TaxID=2728037 RepID=UPI001475ACF1|nr:RNA polymerase sigma factor [Tautonia rosea]